MVGLETDRFSMRSGHDDRRPERSLGRRRRPRPHPLTFESLEVRFVLSGRFGYFPDVPVYSSYLGQTLNGLGIITDYVFPAAGEQPGPYGDDDRNMYSEF